MTNQEYDEWLEETLNGKPLEAEWWKLNYIESLLPYTSITPKEQSEIYNNLNKISDIEADEIIRYLKENEIFIDPREQYKKMVKDGMFN